MSELTPKKKSFKSIIAHPIKVEYAPAEHISDRVLTTDELQQQIDEARKGKAKVDNEYVNFKLDERGHLFEYKYDYPRFLENMSHVIKEAKKRKAEKPTDVYHNPHKLIIQ
jgi:hypothetical protein